MDTPTKERVRTAAGQARLLYPGPVGELLSQELLPWMVFGHLIGSALIFRVVDDLADSQHGDHAGLTSDAIRNAAKARVTRGEAGPG